LLAKYVRAELPNCDDFDAENQWPAIEEKLAKVRREHNLQNYTFKYTVSDPSQGPQELWSLRDEHNLEDLIATYLENQAQASSLIVPLILAAPEKRCLEEALPRHVWTPPTSIDEDAPARFVSDKTFINVQHLHKLRAIQTEPVADNSDMGPKLCLTLADLADPELV